MSPLRPSPDLAPPLGATLSGDGAHFAVYAGHAEAVELCLYDADDPTGASERVLPMPHRAHGTWFTHVAGVEGGQRYAFRAHGAWDPHRGLRYNPCKLLLDPYGRAVDGQVRWAPPVFGHAVDDRLHGDGEARDDRDSSAYVPRSVLLGDDFDWGDDRPPLVPWAETVVYEAHVKGLTARHPAVPKPLRGTYAGLTHPAVLEHLLSLGVTTVELLPIHAFASEPALVQRGLTNYWGYNTLGFFAPHPEYAAATDPQGVLDEVKGMVKALHAAGIEVLLDVVYNHTAEQSGHAGGTLSWRGLDNRAYYRLDARGRDIDVTGCGNTLDLRHPMVCRMVLDSLRYWVEQVHVDGFRFDLAVALARGRDDGYDPDHPFLVALRTDPVLSRVKLVAEPWDVGVHGWRTGQFPPPFGEWNDRYRDTVRTFWLADVARDRRGEPGHGVRDLATRLAGSEDLFGSNYTADRGPIASINYVAAHDGFTLADTTAYEHKHNDANGEGNRDGHDDNRSWNHGVEGPTTDPPTRAARQRSMRNLLGTLLTATGVPMISSGDELGRTQRGNNNAYCQDNEISWLDWELQPWQEDLLETARFLTRLRREHPVLRQRTFFTGRPARRDGTAYLDWFAADGAPMHAGLWEDGRTRTLVMFLDGGPVGDGSLLIVWHGSTHEREVTLPTITGVTAYRLLWDSAEPRPDAPATPDDEPRPDAPATPDELRPGAHVCVGADSLRVYTALL
ncbi:MAG TPA: glycogen debranching protein GlgX [Segeticoccus sp.]|uniref:glycogen debranching protein GlgX n=1 Tax=Segeticoccus sp. TaxID=2706531 RepID=UPI002D7F951E|nr:glycogen debranching protein GlgX [Segeticoccus sp.]HET8600837.1 glycogen debranching protein GlgX [Segeticoccus sp.]